MSNQQMPTQPQQPSEPSKKPFYKKWWFITICVILGLAIIGGAINGTGEKSTDENTNNDQMVEQPKQDEQSKQDEQPKQDEQKETNVKSVTLKATCSSGECTAMWGGLSSNNSETFSGTFEKTISDLKDDEIYSITVTGDLLTDDQEFSCEALVGDKSHEKNSGSGNAGSAHCQVNPWDQ